jgi:Holliday junction resolvase-like predicted endonuclease
MENIITKSTRHSEILGKFGEYVVCNWLSRCGFEVCVVNHTGLDIIAYHPKSKHRLGITVKSRTRKSGKESESVNVFFRNRKDRKKLQIACKSFGCEPWLAIYVECGKVADMYLTSLASYDSNYKSKKARAIDAWSMTKGPIKAYASDPSVAHIHFDFNDEKWPPLR